jgi:hypothetical protein
MDKICASTAHPKHIQSTSKAHPKHIHGCALKNEQSQKMEVRTMSKTRDNTKGHITLQLNRKK